MQNIIYYFTGTGNSLNTARIIADEIGGAELISVKKDPAAVSAKNADMIGFVCPVYEWDVPSPMKEFVEKLVINPDAYIFMVVTYILVYGKSFETIAGLLETKDAHISFADAIRCVASQCIVYDPFPPEKIMTPYSNKRAVSIGERIAEKAEKKYPKQSSLIRKLYSRMMTPFMNIQHEYDKGFYASENCTGCGICMKICPCSNISIVNRKPQFHHKCIACNACVAYCPRKAIMFSKPEAYAKLNNFIANRLSLPEKRKRYHHPDITARDIMKEGEVRE
ncbi:MAG: EFR1 family ferrodoxin [Anaerolineaceae bacterium]|nr:EFR1 family ferrodoxin [Anaerolineaceae bacterium]